MIKLHMAYKNNNQPFVCKNCGRKVPKLKVGNRDHCPFCLHGLHVDIEPGDRNNTCHGILKPLKIVTRKGKQQIEFKCESCGDTVYCLIAPDDNLEVLNKAL
ncbi:RNHCP domain-containing protein [Candidatus Dojkabacteria bacterium]|nr:RNHCP domain-containing protein [Candidatus Dojkabacteria bacterium]